MVRETSPRSGPLRVGVFGTTFFLDNYGSKWHDFLKPRLEGIHEAIRQRTEEFIRRQKRRYVMYWDAIAYLHSAEATRGGISDDHGLLIELTLAMQERQIHSESVIELTNHRVLKNVRSLLVYYPPDPKTIAQHALQRGLSARLAMDSKGRLRNKEAGFYREFELDLGDMQGSVESLDMKRLVVLAVLVQLKADLELYYETGFRRLRCCENPRCRSWFVSPAMGSRQRFCSTLCRVQANRDTQ